MLFLAHGLIEDMVALLPQAHAPYAILAAPAVEKPYPVGAILAFLGINQAIGAENIHAFVTQLRFVDVQVIHGILGFPDDMPVSAFLGTFFISSWNCSKKGRLKSKSWPKPSGSQSSLHHSSRSYILYGEFGEYMETIDLPDRSEGRLYRVLKFRNNKRLVWRHCGQNVGGGTFIFS